MASRCHMSLCCLLNDISAHEQVCLESGFQMGNKAHARFQRFRPARTHFISR